MSGSRRKVLSWLGAGGALFTLLPRVALARDPVIYTYDALGRLTSAAYPTGVTVTYTYDAAGNRTQVVTSNGSTPPPPPPPPPPP
ncbi:RHS repeat domain-containing protein, partial [Brevundimonas sp. A19_0]|uniref:RHS repeat domain-containing protein n=1 Tax=Brevundimonas sp. A19_0 TaxID=2821087 RepID=UPI001ADB1F6A